MTPDLPAAALPVFGPDPSPDGAWGGVPWHDGVRTPLALQGLANGALTVFGYRPHSPVLTVTDSDNDLDGPGGSRKVDPCWQGQTSLRFLDGSSCDSRKFPGVVMSPLLEKLGVKLGDFCLVSWNGAVRPAQVYDLGPTRKAGENSICLNRGLGLVSAGKSDRYAAECGHDAQDVATLFFCGSGPGHAIVPALIVDGARACWKAFTGRAA